MGIILSKRFIKFSIASLSLVVMLMIFSNTVMGQSFQQNVFASCGNDFTNKDVIWSYTIGESITVKVNSNNNVLTQGFHQTGIDIINDCDDYLLNSVNVYPNPASKEFYIETEMKLSIVMFDVMGKKVFSGILNDRNNSISVSGLSSGIYIINLSVSCKTRVIKIVVNNENN